MSTVVRLLRPLVPYTGLVLLSILLGVGAVVTNTGLLAAAAYLISAAARHPLMVELTGATYLVRVFGLSRAFVRYGERLVSHNVTLRVLANLRTWFYKRLEPLSPGALADYRSGDLLSRIMRDIEDLEHAYQDVFAPVVVALLTTGLTFGVLFAFFSPILAYAALGFLLATGVGMPILTRRLGSAPGRRQVRLGGELRAQLVDDIQGMPDILAFGRAQDELVTIAGVDRELGATRQRMAAITGLERALTNLLMNLAVVTILVLAIRLERSGQIGGVYLAMLALIMLGSFEAIQPMGRAFQFLGRSLTAWERVVAVTRAEPVVRDPATPRPVPPVPLLEFAHVSFRYLPDEPLALNDVSFTVRPGQMVAIVGPSGGGKTTIGSLAVRFWDPTAGAIRLGGHDIRDYAQDDVRRQIGAVAQETHLFTDTVRGNVLLGNPGATDEQLIDALRRARLDRLARPGPHGLDAWIGEQGLHLSGGERQRLAIARALLKDAPLLILDEATSNLDPITASRVLKAVRALMQDRTTLWITHRLVMMDEMDEIIVLEQGRVVERGTHADLVRARGRYQQMLGIQNQFLREPEAAAIPDAPP